MVCVVHAFRTQFLRIFRAERHQQLLKHNLPLLGLLSSSSSLSGFLPLAFAIGFKPVQTEIALRSTLSRLRRESG